LCGCYSSEGYSPTLDPARDAGADMPRAGLVAFSTVNVLARAFYALGTQKRR